MNTRIPDDVLWTNRGPYWHIGLRWEQISAANDWRPSKGAVCIAALLGKRCRANRNLYSRCFCQEVHSRFGSLIDDHARRWTAADGFPVITFEPYNVADDPSIAEFRAGVANHLCDSGEFLAYYAPDAAVTSIADDADTSEEN